ncbi:MAG: hypothetical protein DKT66_14540 [Candidatus Melainabacteria bacterium]|nr:MAG: hypothetical protein DKT66_14540 [Candidatus Melainabacteria bacterium]
MRCCFVRSSCSNGAEHDCQIDQYAFVPGEHIYVLQGASRHGNHGKRNCQCGANEPAKNASPIFGIIYEYKLQF